MTFDPASCMLAHAMPPASSFADSGAAPGARGGPASRLALRVGLPGLLVFAAFALGVARLWFLSDDAFISFRYARHLVEGHGLVFNPGERVEGYTNFAWVLLMAAFLRAGLPVEWMANVVGVACGAAILGLLARFSARRAGVAGPWIWLAPAALALNRTFCGWSTGGLETQAFALALLAAFTALVAERTRGDAWPWRSALLFALAALTRPEGMLYFGIAGSFLAIDCVGWRRRSPLALLRWLAVFAPIVGAHLLWRWTYYGALLPNTFYAKVSGIWLEQGVGYLGLFVGDHFLFPLIATLPWLLWVRRDFTTGLFTVVLAAQAGYVAVIGGDRFEFRFLAPFLPYLFWLLQEAVREFAARIHSRFGRRPASLAATAGVALVLLSALRPTWLDYPAFEREARHRIARLEGVALYAERRSAEGRFLRRLVEQGQLGENVTLAVGGAGALPYYAGLPTIDFRGLNDAHIARQPVRQRGRVAHEKAASVEYLTERGVVIYDVLNRIVQEEPRCPPPYVRRDFYEGPVRCVAIEGRILAFATTLSDEQFRRVFTDFQILR